MNFLLRSTSPVARVLPSVSEAEEEAHSYEQPKHRRATTLEGLIAEDPIYATEDGDSNNDGIGEVNGSQVDSNSDDQLPVSKHSDVAEHEGWITIPYRQLPDNWSDASDILQLRSLDRTFVFPGEQIHLLVCLSPSKKDTEILTPFKAAAMISKNGNSAAKSNSTSVDGSMFNTHKGADIKENGETMSTEDVSLEKQDISATESLLRMEDHKQKTEALLESFRNSNFFVRIAESDEPLWSKRNVADASSSNLLNVIIDRGGFDGNTSGGLTRNAVRCYSLRNGDVVVLLQVNVATSNIQDPVLEVLQFEKFEAPNAALENINGLQRNHEDPCGELLNWLLPLDRTLPPRPLSPPPNPPLVLGGVTQRSISAASGSSQIFSFGHLRSYSMSSLPQVSVPPSPSKSSFDMEDYDRFSQEKVVRQDMGSNRLLSFRGVSLEPERFSVHCGLEGIYLPGRRWHKKLEIVQPLEIHSFPAECATEDLLCVQVKNVAPVHLPDIIIYLDAIAIVLEESSQRGLPVSLPIASIETGNDHNLPNLSLRRGEEHSFILKPAITAGRGLKGCGENRSIQTHQKIYPPTSNIHVASRVSDVRKAPSTGGYSILVSCHCNYTESKLFFKQPTSWRPHVAKDLMISLAPAVSVQTDGRISQLPVQVLTLQASNLTSEDLTLTILAPVESNSSTLVVPQSSTYIAPKSPFGLPEFMKRPDGLQRLSSLSAEPENHKETNNSGKKSVSLGLRMDATLDVVSSSDLGFTHLWLQSTVPLGCVPAGSSATAKLELLPLTDGIITLNTLEVAVKEKGLTYRPEQPLKINATSSGSTAIA